MPALPRHATAARQPIDLGQVARNSFLILLAIALTGYGTFSRSFAYLGVAPLFIGEICLGLGLLAVLACRPAALGRIGYLVLPLILFMGWGAMRTVPYIGQYKVDALRDGVLWGYGAFAICLCAVLVNEPQRFRGVVRFYKAYAIAFLLFTPLVAVASHVIFHGEGPKAPWADVSLFTIKGSDLGAHLAGIFAFVVLIKPLPLWYLVPTMTCIGALMQSSRAAMISFAIGAFATAAQRPKHPLPWSMLATLVFAFLILMATEFSWMLPGEKRDLSAENIIQSIKSVVGDEKHKEMSDTAGWRKNWWSDIVGYTFGGEYFFTGKGYGVNLADSDGYQTEFDDDPLRSPHNGHMTILARSGVPGLALWAAVHLVWGGGMLLAYLRSRRLELVAWERVIFVIGTLWFVFLFNASFDVFLEGPMGGIWFWSIFGAGLAATYLSKTEPHLLDEEIEA